MEALKTCLPTLQCELEGMHHGLHEYPLYIWYCYQHSSCIFLSFNAKLINASLSGGNVTLWMTVVMDLMSLKTAVSILNIVFRL